MITVEQALKIVLERVEPLGSETVPLDQAHGRISAQTVNADIDLPPFDRARMDGYAVRADDVRQAPVTLKLIGEIAAGAQFHQQVGPGEAVKIFTGAPVPEGADAVQKVEVTESHDGSVVIREPVKPGQFITPRASEVSSGHRIADAGFEIGAPEMAALASFGYSEVKVSRRPRVAVISTGSELVDVSTKPTGAQIRNSNSYSIGSYCLRAGALVHNLGTVEDTLEATRTALAGAADRRDLVITSGGVSMGDYDLVKAALKNIGAEIFFDRVIIRPGKPIVFARRGATFFFGLPGNPVSTSVTFNVFARPAILKMQGHNSPTLPTIRAILSRQLTDGSSRRSYLPSRIRIDEGRAIAEPLKWEGSSDLVAFMRANSLIIVPEETHLIEQGETVDVMLLSAI
jgi:molybdopterin molybdotransferase